MALPKTIDLPMDEIERAKTVEEVKTVLKRFLPQYRTQYERLYEALQNKQDK